MRSLLRMGAMTHAMAMMAAQEITWSSPRDRKPEKPKPNPNKRAKVKAARKQRKGKP